MNKAFSYLFGLVCLSGCAGIQVDDAPKAQAVCQTLAPGNDITGGFDSAGNFTCNSAPKGSQTAGVQAGRPVQVIPVPLSSGIAVPCGYNVWTGPTCAWAYRQRIPYGYPYPF